MNTTSNSYTYNTFQQQDQLNNALILISQMDYNTLSKLAILINTYLEKKKKEMYNNPSSYSNR